MLSSHARAAHLMSEGQVTINLSTRCHSYSKSRLPASTSALRSVKQAKISPEVNL